MNNPHANSFLRLWNSTSIYWLGLGIAFVVLAIALHFLRAWYRDGDDPADEDDEIIHQMEDLNRQGVLSDEEFRSIKSRISRRQAR